MEVPVGPHRYVVRVVDHDLTLSGEECDGLCDPAHQTISVRSSLSPTKRVAVCWHEIAHAWKHELDISGAAELAEEAVCNLIGLAMASMSVETLVRLHIYLVDGVEAESAMMLPCLPKPVPVFRLKS